VYREIDRQSIRCHVFRGKIPTEKIAPPVKSINDIEYEGYFCISMFDNPLLGRTVLNFRSDDSRDFLCNTEFQSSVFGYKLSVSGFPFIWQDGEVICCAHASAWMIHRYFSTRYPLYREALPHEILWGDENPWRRLIPSQGLNVAELGSILSRLNYYPEILNKKELKDDREFYCQLHTYIESRIPVIACSDDLEHAVVVIGRKSPKYENCIVPAKTYQENGFGAVQYFDAADFCDALIINDDNYFPYRVWPRECKDKNVPKAREINKIDYVIVPLYEKIFLSARLAKVYGLNILLSHFHGIHAMAASPHGEALRKLITPNEPVIIRTLLTSSKTYLRHIVQNHHSNSTSQFIRFLNLPKFVWIIEASTLSSFFDKQNGINSSGYKIAEVLLDATAGNNLGISWFFIRYPGLIIPNPRLLGDNFNKFIKITNEKDTFPEVLFVNAP
jgi:hypothetical protein